MDSTIRRMIPADKDAVLEMMRTFYASPAVFTNGSEEIFLRDIEQCTTDSPYLEGYVFEKDKHIQGYAMIAKSFSTEFGKPCIWIEDLYIKSEFRSSGLGGRFLTYIQEKYKSAIFRLEVEQENEAAVELYKRKGFEFLPYMEMKK